MIIEITPIFIDIKVGISMALTFKQLKKLIKEEVESSMSNPHNLSVGDEVTLKYFVYAYPSMPTREQMVGGLGAHMIPAGHDGVIAKIQGQYAILRIGYKGKRLIAPVKLQNLEPDDFFRAPGLKPLV